MVGSDLEIRGFAAGGQLRCQIYDTCWFIWPCRLALTASAVTVCYYVFASHFARLSLWAMDRAIRLPGWVHRHVPAMHK